MKVSFIPQETKNTSFPALMRNRGIAGQLVLFEKPGTGTVLSPGAGDDHVGQHCGSWNMHVFERVDGTVTFTND